MYTLSVRLEDEAGNVGVDKYVIQQVEAESGFGCSAVGSATSGKDFAAVMALLLLGFYGIRRRSKSAVVGDSIN